MHWWCYCYSYYSICNVVQYSVHFNLHKLITKLSIFTPQISLLLIIILLENQVLQICLLISRAVTTLRQRCCVGQASIVLPHVVSRMGHLFDLPLAHHEVFSLQHSRIESFDSPTSQTGREGVWGRACASNWRVRWRLLFCDLDRYIGLRGHRPDFFTCALQRTRIKDLSY